MADARNEKNGNMIQTATCIRAQIPKTDKKKEQKTVLPKMRNDSEETFACYPFCCFLARLAVNGILKLNK